MIWFRQSLYLRLGAPSLSLEYSLNGLSPAENRPMLFSTGEKGRWLIFIRRYPQGRAEVGGEIAFLIASISGPRKLKKGFMCL